MLASSLGKAILHPIDTVKAKIQVKHIDSHISTDGSNQSVIRRVLSETIQKDGVGGLYRGISISITGSIPAGALYFGSYEFFKSQTLKNKWLSEHPFVSYLCGGMFAEAIACALFVPVDVIKERRQVQSNLGSY
jgi:hypothetical protein